MKLHTLFSLGLLSVTVSLGLRAGTPLICHPYDIGQARSLPAGNWKGVDPNYDRGSLVKDTLELLTPEKAIIVRMETLRRAAIYATGNLRGFGGGSYTSDDHAVAKALLAKLRERTLDPRLKDKGMAIFDLGFLAETLRHGKLDPEVDGYALLTKVARQHPENADMQFALALASSWPIRRPSLPEHLEKARAGAAPGSLLAVNLASHFRQ